MPDTEPASPAQPSMASWMKELPNITEPATQPIAEPAKPAAAVAAEPPPKPADTTPVKPEDDETKWPRTSEDWKKFKEARKSRETELVSERDTIKSERDRLNSEIETLKRSGPSPELDALKRERDELFNLVRVIDVEKNPQFKAHYEGKTSAQIKLGQTIVGESNAAQFEKIVKMPDGEYKNDQIREFLAGLDNLQTARLGGVLNNLDQIQQERQQAIESEVKNYDTIQQRRKAETDHQATQRRQEAEKTFSTVLGELTGEKGLPMLQKRNGTTEEDAAWNKAVDSRVAYAKNLLEGNHKPADIMKAAFFAASAPAVLEHAKVVAEENARLREQVKALSAAGPRTAGDRAPTDTAPAPVQHKDGSRPMDAAANFMKGIIDARREA